MLSRRILTLLVTAAAVIPAAALVVLVVARVLEAMQDMAAAAVLDRIVLALGIVWGIDLVCLLLALGLDALTPPRDPPAARG